MPQICFGQPSPPVAATASSGGTPSVARAEAALGEYLFEEALRESQQLIKQGGLPRTQFARVLRVRAESLAALSRPAEAQTAYLELLVVEPTFDIDPKLWPRIRAPFFEARALISSTAPPSMRVQRISSTEIRVDIRDPASLVEHVLIRSRAAGEAFREQRLGRSGGVALLVPDTEFQVIAKTATGNQVFSTAAGSSAAETALAPRVEAADLGFRGPAVSPPTQESVFESPVFWIVGGVVAVAAAGLTAAIVVSQ